MSQTKPMKVPCPCLGCVFQVWINWGPQSVRLDKKQALDKLIKHIEKEHTIPEIFELLERYITEYFDKEISKQKEKGR